MGYSPRGRKESDTTERLNFHPITDRETGGPQCCLEGWGGRGRVCVCVCVCARARARVCACTHMPVVYVGVCMACVY